MSFLKRIKFFFFVLVIVLAADAEKIKQVSILHRHGATDEPLVVNGELEWKFAQLTPNGETMMRNLGKLLRATYGTFISAYNTAEYDALTGDSGRCIQSAHGVMRSFFNETSSFIPLIKQVPFDEDWLMAFNFNFPNLMARLEWRNAFQNNATLARKWLSDDDVGLLAGTYGSWCKKTPMLCALLAANSIQCRISNTKSTSTALQTLFNTKLLPIQYESDKYNYGFHPSHPYAVIGSTGYDLATKIMRDAVEGKKKVYHYSSYDVSVLAALNTFGNILVHEDNHKWLPRFGAIFAVTTYTNGNVSFQYAEPEQDAMSTLDYTSGFKLISARCETASGKVYLATQCPIADAWRYVNRSKPTVSNRYCYLRPEDQSHETGKIPSEPLRYYREHCPMQACGANAILDASKGYVCTSLGEHQTLGHYALAASLSTIIPFITGIFIGILVALFLGVLKIKDERRSIVYEHI